MNPITRLSVLAAAGLLLVSCAHPGVRVMDQPEASEPNAFYAGNRPPLRPSPLVRLPIHSIEPRGWLRKQLELQAAGFHGHLGELSDFLKKDGNAWLSPTGEGQRGWEEVPYWLKGFGDCAYILGNEEQIREARIWIEGAFASQRPDGFFGPAPGTKSTVGSTSGKYDLWPNMVMLFCLQSYYEHSGDPRVLDLMTRYFKWELTVPEEEFLLPYWQQQRGGDNLWSVYWLYNRTGEPWLLDLAAKIHRRTADWTSGIPDWHNVNMSQAFGGPTFWWMQSGDPKHLEAAERNYGTIREMYGQVPGAMFGGDENCRPGFADPRQCIETCGMVEMMHSQERLLQVTGDTVWADRCEDVAFNSMPAALLADFKALRYLTAPNQVISDRLNKAPGVQNDGPMFHMNPYMHRCCQHNVGYAWPYFVESLWMATPGNGLAASFYGPCRLKVKAGRGVEVTIVEETRYPFSDEISFTISAPEPVKFPLYLRVPGWCRRPSLAIHAGAAPKAIDARPGSWIRVEVDMAAEEKVTLKLPMEISLRRWEKNQGSVSVDRGPLTYSLRIGEKYIREGGTEKWPAWEIHPTTPWNYGLVLGTSDPASQFKVIEKGWPQNDMPFTQEGVPLEIQAQGRKIPNWQTDSTGLVGKLQPSPVKSDEPIEDIPLIPMGAARLRISSFPVTTEALRIEVQLQPERSGGVHERRVE